MFSERRLLVLALLVSVAQSTALGLRLGRRQVRPHLGHGVAEGNGPSGLYGFFGEFRLFCRLLCRPRSINDFDMLLLVVVLWSVCFVTPGSADGRGPGWLINFPPRAIVSLPGSGEL